MLERLRRINSPDNSGRVWLRRRDITVVEADREYFLLGKAFVADQYVKYHKDFDLEDFAVKATRYTDLLNDVLKDIFEDEYGTIERSVTFPAFTKHAGYVGNMRLGLGQANTPFFLETASLMKPTSEWPHRLDGLTDDQVGEIGRVVVTEGQRPHNTKVILKSLVDAGFEKARERGIKQIYIIMPTKLSQHFKNIGIELETIESELRRDNPDAESVFTNYSGYWDKMNPKLYRLKVPGKVETAARNVHDIFTRKYSNDPNKRLKR